MSDIATFKIDKTEFVVIPKKRYERLTRLERNQKDAEIARKAMEKFDAGTLETVSLEEARKGWGV